MKRGSPALHGSLMKWLLLLILALGLASCTHTALAPLTTPGGVPIAIRVPGVPAGGQARPSQVLAIDEKHGGRRD